MFYSLDMQPMLEGAVAPYQEEDDQDDREDQNDYGLHGSHEELHQEEPGNAYYYHRQDQAQCAPDRRDEKQGAKQPSGHSEQVYQGIDRIAQYKLYHLKDDE